MTLALLRILIPPAVVLAAVSDLAAARDAGEIQAALAEIRRATLEPDHAVRVRDLTVPGLPALLELREGLLVPATRVAGSVHEAVFVGQARFRFEPPDEIESRELEFLTKNPIVDVELQQLVLLSDDPSLLDSILESGEPAPLPGSEQRRLEAIFEDWTTKDVRRWFEAEAAILQPYVDGKRDGPYLALWCHSESLGSFFFHMNPYEQEPVSLGRFEVDPDDYWKNRRDIASEIWVQTSNASGEPKPGSTGFEAQHYDLVLTVPPRAKSEWKERWEELYERRQNGEPTEYVDPGRAVEGTAKITLLAKSSERRFVRMVLHPELEIRTIVDARGDPLFWFRSRYDVYAVLPAPAAPGERFDLTVTYAGEILDEVASDHCRLRSTQLWHPHVGLIDRATYEMTFRWPENMELLASGLPLDAGIEAGRRWERRVLPVRTLGATFEIGRFEILEEQVGRFKLRIAINRFEAVQNDVRDEVVQVVKASLLHYESLYGPHPLDHVTVVTVHRNVSQGFLGFVTLSQELLIDDRSPLSRLLLAGQVSERDIRLEIVAHEVAHQWWGNKVGWVGDRDLWLSEALADYAALQFMTQIGKHRPEVLAKRGRTWRDSLLARTGAGLLVEQLGPVGLGSRLAVNHGHDVYHAIVYDKGSVVFSMLAHTLGREPFNKMLRALADAANNRVIDTDTFLRSIEHMSGADLRSFARRFIYRTGVPELFYDYEIVPSENGWTITGRVKQLAAPQYRYEPVLAEGRWLVRRTLLGEPEVSDLPLVVPFQIALKHAGPAATTSVGPVEAGLGGTIVVRGAESRFAVPLEREPRQLWLDQGGEVFATFFSAAERPKRAQRYLAEAHALAGDHEAAESGFRAALEADVFAERARSDGIVEEDRTSERTLQDVQIHLGLARLHLDRGDADLARVDLQSAESLLDDESKFAEGIRCVLHGRIDLIEGDFKSAFRRLDDHLLPSAKWLRQTVRKEYREWLQQDAESFVILAVAAHETGREDLARVAAEEAERRGARMDALTALFPQSPPRR